MLLAVDGRYVNARFVGVTGQKAVILSILHKRYPEPTTTMTLWDALDYDRERRGAPEPNDGSKLVHVHIRNLRIWFSKRGFDDRFGAIDTRSRGVGYEGYVLTPEAYAWVESQCQPQK